MCQCNIPSTDIWTIHGLWPKNNSNPTQEKFNVSNISHLIGQLNDSWPDVLYKRNEMFWEHEWTKHGTHLNFVSNNHLSEYFEKALAIYHNANLNNINYSLGLKPSFTSYSKEHIEQKLSKAFNVKIVLYCMKCINKYDMNCLVEIRICYDDDIKHPNNCTISSNCYKNVIIYPRRDMKNDFTRQYICNNKAKLNLPVSHIILITICWVNILFLLEVDSILPL